MCQQIAAGNNGKMELLAGVGSVGDMAGAVLWFWLVLI